jgi:MerR family mercuric resistance operon transcriptional regulator
MKAKVEAKIEDIEQKIADLEQIREALVAMAEKCRGKGPIGECPILEALYKNNI